MHSETHSAEMAWTWTDAAEKMKRKVKTGLESHCFVVEMEVVVGSVGEDEAQHEKTQNYVHQVFVVFQFHILICPTLLLDSFDLIVPARRGLKA